MGIEQSLASEPVARLPIREAIQVTSDTIVRSAVAQMRNKQIGCAVVVDDHQRPLGIFTERSMIDVLVNDKSLDSSRVGDHLDADWFTVRKSDTIDRVFRAVQDRGLRFICVTDDAGKLIGITGQRGLSEFFAEHFPQQVMVQHFGSKPAHTAREGA